MISHEQFDERVNAWFDVWFDEWFDDWFDVWFNKHYLTFWERVQKELVLCIWHFL